MTIHPFFLSCCTFYPRIKPGAYGYPIRSLNLETNAIKLLKLLKTRGHTFLKIAILWVSIYVFPAKGFSQQYPYKFEYLTVDEGLSHTDANDIAQDKHGYIWIATFFGLDRFDGYYIKKFYNDNSPLDNAFKNRVRCLYPDNEGNIWLGTENGLQCFNTTLEKYIDYDLVKNIPNEPFSVLYKPDGDLLFGIAGTQLKIYNVNEKSIHEQPLNLPKNIAFRDLAHDSAGTLFFATNCGIWSIGKKGVLEKWTIRGLKNPDLSNLSFDHRGNLLISEEHKIYLLQREDEHGISDEQNTVSDNMHVFTIQYSFDVGPQSNIKNYCQNGIADYWINTGTNLQRLDSTLHLVQVVSNNTTVGSVNSNSLSKIMIDRSGCLWICTFGEGVNYCDLNEKLFFTLQHNPEMPNSLSNNHIRSVMAEGDRLWIGTTTGGLNSYDFKTQKFTFYNDHSSSPKLNGNVITALCLDKNDQLWIGTDHGINVLKKDRKTLWKPNGYDQFPNYNIETIARDCYGNMWFGNHVNHFGVIWKDKQNTWHVRYYGEGYYILADSNKPQLLISSTQGLKRVFVDSQGNIVKTYVYKATNDKNSLSSNYTYPLCKENDSTYWIGTIGGGLNKLSLNPQNNGYSISRYNGFGIFNDVETMEIDEQGNIWMGGNGLECLNPKTGKLIRYDKNDGLQGNSFKVGASFRGSDGRLYFGGINGLNYFFPAQIKTNLITAIPVLTDILVNNQRPRCDKESKANSVCRAIGYCSELQLDYLQNNFQIFFSSMHFANPLKCRYRYKLIGFDKDWKYTNGKNPSAFYSNLDFDQYKFIVEATNNDGIWSSAVAETSILITPPWWKSNLAKLIYLILILSALSGIYIYQARWYRLKREIGVREVNERKKEEMHKQHEELYQQQLQFFTNVSHEFRTPLTLILGPLETLISQNKNSVVNGSYQLMHRNAKRLVNLISELMNFKKVADSVIRLQVQPLVVSKFCKEIAQEFQNLASAKDIEFTMTDHTKTNMPGSAIGYFDVQILEKILFNLLSNSIKYTNVGGAISFDIFSDRSKFKPSFDTGFELLNENYRAEKYIYFRVADSGIGISGESITRIFDRYYRVSKNHLGSGVGLALVKSLTQLHKGDILVYSERYKGTEIIIGIPYKEENYTETEKAPIGTGRETLIESIDNTILIPYREDEADKPVAAAKIQKHILLVDDNHELRAFLKQTFDQYYYTYEAADGNEAIAIATEKVPDLIISDVMMPGMNGIELCSIVKEKFETRHIPFIILSAKDALDTKIEGMESGADFYFAKPLSIDLLLLTVQNLFDQREKLKERYTKNYLVEATELVHSTKDKEFFEQILKLIEDNIPDPDLDVDFLCRHLCISRTKLYQKIKSISEQSVGEFIRTIRLKKAIQIMTHEDITMNEVGDRIGLQSSSNFSRAFKKEYGKSPLQYMQALKKN